MENTRPTASDIACAAIFIGWIAAMLNAPAICTFLTSHLPL